MKKFIYFLSIVLAMFIATSTLNAAQVDYSWTGLGDGSSWDDLLNWDQLEVPTHDSTNVWLLDTSNGTTVNIADDVVADCTWGHVDGYGTVFGPENGMTLNIHGDLTYQWYMAPFETDSNTPVTINMYGNSSIYGGEGIALGDNWWTSGGPYVTMNMYDNSSVDINWLWFGGQLNVYGGVFDVEFGHSMSGNVADDLMKINITEGMIVLPDPNVYIAIAQDLIDRGILMAYDGTGTVIIDGENAQYPGRTVLTGIPEPATIALLGLGGLALIRRKRS